MFSLRIIVAAVFQILTAFNACISGDNAHVLNRAKHMRNSHAATSHKI
jgi:hypothetical protein